MSTKTLILILLFEIISLKISAQNKLERLQKFAITLENAILEKDQALLDSHFDTEDFMSRVLIKSKSKDIKALNQGFSDAMNRSSLAEKILLKPIIAGEYDYQLIRVYYKKGAPHLLFRLSGDNGLNYHDLLLKPYGLNSYKIVDIFVYYSGEYLSETFKRIYMSLGKKYFSKKRVKGLPDYSIEDVALLAQVKQLVDQQDFKKAAEQMSELGEEIRKEKAFRLLELSIKTNLNDEEYMNALAAYRKSFPNDPSANLISLDYLTYNEEYDKLIKAINDLDKQLGGDTFLNLHRASAYFADGKLETAEKLLIQFNQDHPDQLDGLLILLEIYITDNRFADCIKILETVRNDFYFGKTELADFIESEPSDKDFTSSKEFIDWKRAN